MRISCVMTGIFDRKWKGRTSVPKHWEFFKWTLKIFANFDHWLKCMTCVCVISLRWLPIMAIHKCYAIRLKLKNLLSPTPHACSPLLALSIFIGAGQPLQHGEVRDSYLAWVRPVVPSVTILSGGQDIEWKTGLQRMLMYSINDSSHWLHVNYMSFWCS